MKICASALMVIAATTGALAQSLSEQFGILTIHRYVAFPPNIRQKHRLTSQYRNQCTFADVVVAWSRSLLDSGYQSHHVTRRCEWSLV